MKQIDFDIELKTSDLYRFTMRHTYYSISGIFSLIISIGSLMAAVFNITKFSASSLTVLFVIGALFTVVQPIMLYMKCATQRKRNQNINDALHYSIKEDGIEIQQKENSAEVKWYDIRKKVFTKKDIYLYMSPVRAFIFPKSQCEAYFEEIQNMVTTQMEKYKDYVPEEEEEDMNNE